MIDNSSKGFFGEPVKGRIGVLIEEHFDQTEFKKFNAFFSKHGYRARLHDATLGQPIALLPRQSG